MTSHKEKVLEFWNQRAQCGDQAGTNDFMLKYLEEKVLLEKIPAGARVLDIGCGNGATLLRLVQEKGCRGLGIDYAAELVAIAVHEAAARGLNDTVTFRHLDLMHLDQELGPFDCIITQRCLINLETLEEQQRAFEKIIRMLPPGGRYFMIESFHDGNRALNVLREGFHLEPMAAPWHNRFFELAAVRNWEGHFPAVLEEVSHFASTYYLLSRVVYAKLAADRNEPLRYDSDINTISLQLPPLGEFGATKLLVWRKRD